MGTSLSKTMHKAIANPMGTIVYLGVGTATCLYYEWMPWFLLPAAFCPACWKGLYFVLKGLSEANTQTMNEQHTEWMNDCYHDRWRERVIFGKN